MKRNRNYKKREKKRFTKRTLKKRIFKVISLSNLGIILFLGVAIFLAAIVFLKGSAITMSYFISSNIVKDMSSEFFLEQMNIDSLEELKPDSKQFKYWAYNFDKTLSLNFSTQIQKHIGLGPGLTKRRDNLQDQLEEFENIEYESFIDIEDEKLVDFNIHYAITYIKIKDRIIYKTGKGTYGDIQDYINNLPQWEWLRNQIAETVVEVPIYDQNDEEIGVVTTCLNHKLLIGTITILLTGIVSIGVITFIISKIVTRLFAMPMLHPLKELQDKMDEVAREDIGEDFGKPITFKKPFYEIERLASSTNMIMCKMKEYAELLQQQKDEMEAQRDELESQKEELETLTNKLGTTNKDLEQKNHQIENIFNNVSQGFLTFGLDLKVRQEYSFECKRIFKKHIEEQYFPELIFHDDPDQIQFLDDILKRILEEKDPAKVRLYIPLLPREIMIHNRHIHITYKVVNDIMVKQGKAFMLILTDITEKKALERQWNEERRLLRMVVKVISNQDVFLELVDDFKEFTKSVQRCALSNEECFEECYYEFYRQIHTFKGNFSQFDMDDITNELHNLESSLTKEKERIRKEGRNGFVDLILKSDFDYILTKDLHILEKYLGKDFFAERDIIKIRKNKILEIEEKIKILLPKYEQNQLLLDVRRLRYKSLKELLSSYTEYVLKLSERMGKEVKPFDIDGDDVLVDPDYYSEFIKSLVHVFRNCVDHGIEDPEERFTNDKSEIGVIRCSVANYDNYLEITISDDGKGMDFDMIRYKLADNNLCSKEEAEDLEEDDLLQVIFMDAFSTENEIAEISGRGVGLSAVKNELEKIKGRVKVITDKGKGTSFIFTIPLKQENIQNPLYVDTIINSLTETAEKYIREQTSINLQSIYNKYKRVEKINLNQITVLINIKGDFNAIFVLSINEELARELVKGFVIDELTPEELSACIDDVVAESTNIILGNSIKTFDDMDYIVNIGAPTILCYKGATIKNMDSNIVTTELAEDEYRLNLSIISIDNNMLEEEGLWHVS